jgi:hypothetical protein
MLIFENFLYSKSLNYTKYIKNQKNDAKMQHLWILLQLVTIFLRIEQKNTKKVMFIINN